MIDDATAPELWDVRVLWTAAPGASAPASTTHVVAGESQAVDAAVSVLDGSRHPWAPVRATSAEIRRTTDDGPWRRVASSTYL